MILYAHILTSISLYLFPVILKRITITNAAISAKKMQAKRPRIRSIWKTAVGIPKKKVPVIRQNIKLEYIVMTSGAPLLLSSKLGKTTPISTPIPVNRKYMQNEAAKANKMKIGGYSSTVVIGNTSTKLVKGENKRDELALPHTKLRLSKGAVRNPHNLFPSLLNKVSEGITLWTTIPVYIVIPINAG